MGLMSFYKPNKPSKFRYTYRYYDAKKEELQKKINRARRKYYPEEFEDEDVEQVKDNIRGAFHRQSETLGSYKRDDDIQGALRQKNWTLLLVLVLLLVFFLWLYDNIGIKFFAYLGF